MAVLAVPNKYSPALFPEVNLSFCNLHVEGAVAFGVLVLWVNLFESLDYCLCARLDFLR